MNNVRLMTGPRGGRYYIDKSGKKRYVKNMTKDPNESTLYKYSVKINQFVNDEIVDTIEDSVEATSKPLALHELYIKYPEMKEENDDGDIDEISYEFLIYRKQVI